MFRVLCRVAPLVKQNLWKMLRWCLLPLEVVVSPHEMRTAMQAECVQVDDSAHATQRQPLLVFAAGRIFAAMREEAAAPFDRSAGRRLQRGEGDDRRHGNQRGSRAKIARVAGD